MIVNFLTGKSETEMEKMGKNLFLSHVSEFSFFR